MDPEVLIVSVDSIIIISAKPYLTTLKATIHEY